MKTIKQVLLVALLCMAAYPGVATPIISDNKPWSILQVGIVPDAVALVPSDIPVLGVNAEFFCGMQKRVGILNFQPVVGISDTVKGVSLQGFGFNSEMLGFQVGVLHFQNYFCGLDLAVVTGARENHGCQIGAVNLSGESAPALDGKDAEPPSADGVQIGLFNCATSGFQFGVFNYNAESVIPFTILFNYSSR